MGTLAAAGRGLLVTLLGLVLGGIGAWPSLARGPDRSAEKFAAFLETLWPEAQGAGVRRSTFDRALRGLEPDFSLPDLDLPGKGKSEGRGQAEFTRPPQAYLAKAQLSRLAGEGRALLARHRNALELAERTFGVERTVILAIWGRETAFGAHKPSHSAIRVLATHAFTGRRKDLFRRELMFALRLIEDGIATVETMRSSWAGAMGLTQFMPSEFYSSGHDLDGDGRVDLFNSIPDALGSAAKQLKQKGWLTGVPWGFEVKSGPRVDCANEGPLNARAISEWISLGVTRADGRPFIPEHLTLSTYLMSPGGGFGPQFLVTENFKVLRAYNMSDFYALFVGHLADRIAGGGDFRTGWGDIKQLSTRDIEELQSRLKTHGYAIDKIDGKIGSNTRWQIGLYERAAGLDVRCWPTLSVLNSLRQASRP
jgi:lytic murein transglycosylase